MNNSIDCFDQETSKSIDRSHDLDSLVRKEVYLIFIRKFN